MPREPHHSPNWGGKRPGAGRPRGGFNELTRYALEKAAKATVHPVDFLLNMVGTEKLTMKERGATAQALLPYVASRLSVSEITVTNELENRSEGELVSMLAHAHQELASMGIRVIEHQAEQQ